MSLTTDRELEKESKSSGKLRTYVESKYDELCSIYEEKISSGFYKDCRFFLSYCTNSHAKYAKHWAYMKYDDDFPYDTNNLVLAKANKSDLADRIVSLADYGVNSYMRLLCFHNNDYGAKTELTVDILVEFNIKDNDFFADLKNFLASNNSLITEDPSEYLEKLITKQAELENIKRLVTSIDICYEWCTYNGICSDNSLMSISKYTHEVLMFQCFLI
jgi:hypothetical protein